VSFGGGEVLLQFVENCGNREEMANNNDRGGGSWQESELATTLFFRSL